MEVETKIIKGDFEGAKAAARREAAEKLGVAEDAAEMTDMRLEGVSVLVTTWNKQGGTEDA